MVNTASDQPGVSPPAPASSAAFVIQPRPTPAGYGTRVILKDENLNYIGGVASPAQKSLLSSLTGGLLG